MCLLIFAHQVSPRHPLLIAANRDEFHARPTAASDFWPEHPDLLAGKDLQQGGTWMGITRQGRFAAVTNFRDPAQTAAAPRSRGELPLSFLTGSASPLQFLQSLAHRAGEYAGFNLLVGDRNALCYFSNSDSRGPISLPPGVYGLSNASLDTPWPKVERGKAALQHVLEQDDITHEALANIVADRSLAAVAPTDLDDEHASMAALLSAQFIVTSSYGTRSRTTLWSDIEGRGSWREESFDAQGNVSQTSAVELLFSS